MIDYVDYVDYDEYDINNTIIDTQMNFEYDYKYKTMLRNKLSPIVLLKQLNVPYGIDAKGKLYIKKDVEKEANNG